MKHQHGDRLSWGDSVFLNLERDGMPLNVACICVLEGDIPFRTYLQFVESRLLLIPRYLMRVVPPPLNIGLPIWDYDPEFNIKNHVGEVTLKDGSDADLKALAGKIFGKVMDRQHPLWDLTLVRGLKGNRTGIIARMHHCLADGIAGVGVMSALMDASPAVPRLPKRKTRLRVPPPRDAAPSLVDGLTNSYSNFMERILSGWADVLNITERTLANGGNAPSEDFSSLMPEITAPTERLRFNVLYRGPQRFACTEIPLAEVKAIRHACGTSINDVLLALVTATIRRYSEIHGDRVKGRLLRIMVPVNLRGNNSSDELGNRISLVAVTIPLDIRPPEKLLAEVHRRTEFLKRAHAAELVGMAGGLLGMLPCPIQAFAGPMISQVPFTPFNMVCTNVPGPQFPLYVLGHKMLRWYPYVPIGGELALNCAILSYNGMVYFGFSGDANITPDMTRFEKLLQSNFTELRNAAGIKVPQNKPAKKRAPKTKQAAPKPALRPAEKPATTLQIPISLVGTKPSAESAAPRLIFEKKTLGNHVEERIFEARKVLTQPA
ncbi:MAG: wax ester/triacylglycerol synthase family O-acyltransferase [Terriglobales bacterium]